MIDFYLSRQWVDQIVRVLCIRRGLGSCCWSLALGSALVMGLSPLGYAQTSLRVQGDSDPVKISVSVTAASGSPLSDLVPSAFQITEDGASQPIVVTQASGTRPVAIVIAMDYSGSMRDSNVVAPMEQAVTRLLATLGGEDQAAILKFKGGVFVAQGLTSDKQALATAITQDFTGGKGTRLYDAINVSLDMFNNSELSGFSPAIVVLSDGDDSGSQLTLDQLANNVDAANVPLFAIGFGDAAGLGVLKQLALASGGVSTETTDLAQLDGIYDAVGARLKTEYVLEYHSALSDCGAHSLEVVVDTGEGVKRYSGALQRCFPTINPVAAGVTADPSQAENNGGGGVMAWLEWWFLVLVYCKRRRYGRMIRLLR